MKRFPIREFALLSLPILLFAVFPVTKRLFPPKELRMESCQILAPTTLERYMGYDSAIEIVKRAPLENTQHWEYEMTDASGKRWSWEKPEHLKLLAGGMSRVSDNSYSRRSEYRRPMHSQPVFNGAGPVILSWFERKDRNNEAVKLSQQTQLDPPKFDLPPLHKPAEAPFEITEIELENKTIYNLAQRFGEIKIKCWLKGTTQPRDVTFLREWNFLQDGSFAIRAGGLNSECGMDQSGTPFVAKEFIYERWAPNNQLKGLLATDNGWPMEITVKLPSGWEKSAKPFLVKFDTRIADLPTEKQLDEMNNWWPKNAK